jgi:hypothetical protein
MYCQVLCVVDSLEGAVRTQAIAGVAHVVDLSAVYVPGYS